MPSSLLVKTYPVGPLDNNTYLVADQERGEAVLVDPGMESEFLVEEIRKAGYNLRSVLNTHGHFDHIFHNALFTREFDCPLYIHEADLFLLESLQEHAAMFGFSVSESPKPDGFLGDGQTVAVGSGEMKVLHTPGHTPGGICLASEGFVLSGDTLFAQSIGRTDLPGGSFESLVDSIRHQLYGLPDSTDVLPGHGPATRIGFEKKNNPFVRAD
ncbi:MAG: MBL fold metallo-hydrolase [Acidobacteriota bacterium]